MARTLHLAGPLWTMLYLLCTASGTTWYHHTRNLNASLDDRCTGSLSADLALHFNEALLDIMLHQATGDIGDTRVETCQLTQKMVMELRARVNASFVFLEPTFHRELQAAAAYYDVVGMSDTFQPAMARLPSLENFGGDASSAASLRGFYRSPAQLTSGPSLHEVTNAVYSTLLSFSWSYVGLVWEAEPGAERLSQQLRASAQSDRRVCFPLLLSFRSSNVTDAARALKDFAYTAKRLSRFAVVYVGSGSAFLSLWDLVAGSEGAYSDSEKRYQFAVVGEAFSSYHRMSSPTRHGNLALGTVFIFPGILDPDPSTDELQLLFSNITSDPASMGRFTELRDTHARLKSLKDATSSMCTWHDANNFCYQLALRYDFLALGFASLLADGAPTLSTLADVQNVRKKEVSLTALRANFTILNSFIREGFTTYSLHNGLQHSSRGYWQPIVKVYQSQLSGSSYALKKLGELRVKQAGTSTQTYEFDLSTNSSQFYQLTGGDPGIPPVPTSDSASECPSSCPECVGETKRQFIQFREGDIYLGALVPVFYKGNDAFDCTDGSFRAQNVGGYEFAMAFKFVVDLVDSLSQESLTFPAGFDVSKVDQQFLLGVKDLLQRVHDRRTKRLRWGYVVLDTCYSPSCTVRRLGSLLDGSMGVIPGFNFTKVVGFIGAHGSSQSVQASELLKTYHLPLITYGSTASELSNVVQHPYVMRTGVSTTTVIQVMGDILKHLQVTYIVAVYVKTDFGESLKNELLLRAEKDKLCIGEVILYDCDVHDSSCKEVLMTRLRNSKARYVPFLADLGSLQAFLNYTQVVEDIGHVTFLTTHSMGTSEAPYAGRNEAGVGALSMRFESEDSPAFHAYENHWAGAVPRRPNSLSQWERLHFESLNRCRLAKAFVRNPQHSELCTDALVASRGGVSSLESRTPLVVHATQTMVLGGLVAVADLCPVVTSEPVCPDFYRAGRYGQAARAKLIMFGSRTAASDEAKPQRFSGVFEGTPWSYRKIFDNRMGRITISIWQYRRAAPSGYQFVQIGSNNGVNSLFTVSAATLAGFERSAYSPRPTDSSTSGQAWCTSVSRGGATGGGGACSDLSCVSTGPTTATPIPSQPSPDPLQGLWALLGLAGVLVGLLTVCLVNCIYARTHRPDEYNDPYYRPPNTMETAQPVEATGLARNIRAVGRALKFSPPLEQRPWVNDAPVNMAELPEGNNNSNNAAGGPTSSGIGSAGTSNDAGGGQ